MQKKSQDFMNHLAERNVNSFNMDTIDTVDLFTHTEIRNGISIPTSIIIGSSPFCNMVFQLAYCADEDKHDELLLLLNQLNVDRTPKYYLKSDNCIMAEFTYTASDSYFDPDALLSLYIISLNCIYNDGDLNRIMKIVWS